MQFDSWFLYQFQSDSSKIIYGSGYSNCKKLQNCFKMKENSGFERRMNEQYIQARPLKS